MADCCASNQSSLKGDPKIPKKYTCPVNAKSYLSVALKTIYQHLNKPWNFSLNAQNYYFCEDPNCEVVYFGLDNSLITQKELRTKVGIKDQSDDSILCYCFDVTRKDYAQDANLKQFVVQKTKSKQCACDIRNPSGKCCLKNFK
ncbi:MAG: hypothetical protein Q9M92_05900 [Enterobacterales bacterium]|nr:hypothetical protein [Enterobacterales bacterium]